MNKRSILAAGYAGIFFFGISFLTLGSVLPSLRETLHLDMAQSSALAGILPFGVLAGSVVFGPWCDRYGYKMPFQWAAAMVVLGFIGLSTFTAVSWLGTCVFITGAGGGILNGACNALVTDVSDDRNRSSNLSILGVFYGLGALIMPLILGIFDFIPYSAILRYMAVFLFLVFVYFSIIRFPEAKVRQGFPIKEGLSMLRQPALLFFSFILFFQSALEGLCSNWIPIFLQDSAGYRLSQQNALFLLTFVVVGMTAGRVLLSWLAFRYKPWKILWWYLLVLAAGFTGLAAGFKPLVPVILRDRTWGNISGYCFLYRVPVQITVRDSHRDSHGHSPGRQYVIELFTGFSAYSRFSHIFAGYMGCNGTSLFFDDLWRKA